MQRQPKTIPASRDLLQSRILTWTIGLLLLACLLPCLDLMIGQHALGLPSLRAFGIALTFGFVVWALRAATLMAALCGALICLLSTVFTLWGDGSLTRTALTPLLLLFLLTFAATRLGKRARPDFTPSEESRRGRRASQIIANLGCAPLLLFAGAWGWFGWAVHPARLLFGSTLVGATLFLAALAEATADTVSSELGQAYGGTPYLLTNLKKASAGTDGAISELGTAAGIFAAALVTAAGAWAMHLTIRQAFAALAGATAGLLFDSLLGATVERRGWLNNDLVNFSSTAFAAAFTLLLLGLWS